MCENGFGGTLADAELVKRVEQLGLGVGGKVDQVRVYVHVCSKVDVELMESGAVRAGCGRQGGPGALPYLALLCGSV